MKLFRVLFLTVGLLSPMSYAGNDGHGGSGILCNDGKLYSWDYIQTLNSKDAINPDILNARSAKEILSIIHLKLKEKIPQLAEKLQDFMLLNEDPFNHSTRRVWVSGDLPLVPLNDEEGVRVPKHCKSPGRSLQLHQAVRRTAPGKIMYEKDDAVLMRLEQNSPLQLSFLYVHEFLRDFTDDGLLIQRVNRLLHSNSWVNKSGEELQGVFKGYGFSYKMFSSKNSFPLEGFYECLGVCLVTDVRIIGTGPSYAVTGRVLYRHRSYRFKVDIGKIGDVKYTGIGKLDAEDNIQVGGYRYLYFELTLVANKDGTLSIRTRQPSYLPRKKPTWLEYEGSPLFRSEL